MLKTQSQDPGRRVMSVNDDSIALPEQASAKQITFIQLL